MLKKICFIVPSLGGGGAERVAIHLMNNLNLEKFEINVIIIYKDKGDYLEDLREEVKRIYLNKKKISYSVFSLLRIIKKEKPDIVINFSFISMIIIGNFIIPFFRRIYYINRQTNILSSQNFNLIKKLLLKRAYKNFNKIITQSKDMTQDLLQNINICKNKIVEINNPIDLEKIESLSNEKIEIELKKDNKNLLCVGRLAKQKGFDVIINIISLLKNKNIKLYILGEGEERKNLEKLIQEKQLEKQVFLLGRKKNPYIYMKKADLFILSSRYEGFPNALIEANACGLYAICNNCPGGVNEIIEENINGNIINFEDMEATKNLILEKVNLGKNRDKIVKKIKRKYSLKKIIQKYEIVLGEK
ncbi:MULTISPECIES: glycosyltransferase [Fusobacterium]|uniref:Glycosyltransferase n=1 Tax=Fusobacterium mortiferum ATCC 9817 TaxID=469616 RepID=A0ABN5J7J5_FUSMR|nr:MULTISPECIES: glycosyltransferase [Fusobacterium]AVQ18144.1 glycosyltransferase [Fusobacterium mortiferum ATCC 9817]EEO36675.1 glycosyltransferase, group 1 family protein [Fusobacterium mortiferum ATCC 9817]MDY2799944.1 glycosyltransferase [Fusobacterium mortiferum]MSS61285.1 glycosyltransferase [Fusobacterium sp. FSA-380-WT-2B]